MNRLQRTLALLKASQKVVETNRSLLAYPFISFLSVLILVGAIIIPGVFGGIFLLAHYQIITPTNIDTFGSNQILKAVATVLGLIALQIVLIYCNTAFYYAADSALKGEVLSLKQAFGLSWKRRVRILQWSVFNAVVGFGFQTVGQKLGIVARIFSFVGSLAWALATVFAVPVLVTQDLGPVEVVKKSSALFKKTWGENMTMGLTIGMLAGISLLGFLIVPIPVTVALLGLGASTAVFVVLGSLWALALIFVIAYFGTMQAVFNAALYRYAEFGDYMGPFTEQMMQEAFIPRRKVLGL